MVVARVPTLVVGGKTLSPAQVILPVEIAVGRENPTAQPNANSLSFSYLGNLPPNFVRGALVSATLLGYEEPGWSDIWDDMWSHEPSTPGLLPEPTPEGFSEWQRFWGWESITRIEARRNLILNPSLEVDATGWNRWAGTAPGAADFTIEETGGYSGDAFGRATWTVVPASGGGFPYAIQPAVPGTRYAASARIRPSVTLTMSCQWQWYLAGTPTSGSGGDAVVCPAGEWTEVPASAVCPEGSDQVQWRWYISGAGITAVGQTLDIDAVVADPFNKPGYFDGDTPDTTAFDYYWSGERHKSASVADELYYAYTAVTGGYEDGGATLVTDYNSYSGEVFWQGESFSVSGTDRTVRANVRLKPEGGGVMARWDLLWSATNPKPDYFGDDVHALYGEPVTIGSGGDGYMGWTFTAPDEAQYVRLSIVLDSRFSPTWDNAVGTWDDVDPSVTWDTYAG